MKFLWLIGGHISIALGFLGIFLPILPTTPFLLLAAFCYSRGSERYHSWLINHKRFGPIIADWQDGQVIRPRVKIIAVTTLLLFISYPIFFLAIPLMLRFFLGAVALWVCWFILSRPSSASLR